MIGPARIEPGLAPLGLVMRWYTLANELIWERCIDVTKAGDVDDLAAGDFDALLARLPEGSVAVLVVYDGDSGERFPTPAA